MYTYFEGVPTLSPPKALHEQKVSILTAVFPTLLTSTPSVCMPTLNSAWRKCDELISVFN